VSRILFRNLQPFWYAQYAGTVAGYDEYGNQNATYATYGNPVKAYGNISPARGSVTAQPFGDDDSYDRTILLGERDTPIDEHTVLWIDSEPELDDTGALKVNANGDIVTAWDYIVRKVARGLPTYGSTQIAVSKVSVS